MPSLIPVDDGPELPAVREPDAHGQAALLLTESLIHTLVENSAITNAQAIDLIRIAAEVKVEVATAAPRIQGQDAGVAGIALEDGKQLRVRSELSDMRSRGLPRQEATRAHAAFRQAGL
jgi:hypothetical protein